MLSYILRRILLMIPTFLGITVLVFTITQLAPGGPVEMAISQMRFGGAMGGGGSGGGSRDGAGGLNTEAIENLKKFYGFDKPIPIRYLTWLGLYPRRINDKQLTEKSLLTPQRFTLKNIQYKNTMYSLQKWVKVVKKGDGYEFLESGMGADFAFDKYPELPSHSKIKTWYATKEWKWEKSTKGINIYQTKYAGILEGNLGISYTYSRPVIDIIVSKIPISLYFGLIAIVLSYSVNIPLGIRKAVLNNSAFDVASSVIIFVLYAIPAFVLGLVLLSFFASPSFFEIFPLGGFKSTDWDDYPLGKKITDILYHTALPVIVWNMSEFATGTVMMKNSFLENLSQDYVKTGFAKGLTENRVMYVHVLRNSLIPMLTSIGSIIGVIFTGDMLLERVFNIPGAGLLSYTAIIQRDYPIVLGYLVFSSILGLFARLISDLSYAIADPRVRFS